MLHEARECLCERVTIRVGFTSNWMRKWREFCFFKPIVKRSNAKLGQMRISGFDGEDLS